MTKPSDTAHLSEHVKSNTITNEYDWVTAWLRDQGLTASDESDDERIRHELSITLRTARCLLNLMIERRGGDFFMDLSFPAIITDESFPAFNLFLEDFNCLDPDYLLALDKNNGILHLRGGCRRHQLNILSNNERSEMIFRFFNMADRVFPAIMRMQYGGLIPAIATLRTVGFRGPQLN